MWLVGLRVVLDRSGGRLSQSGRQAFLEIEHFRDNASLDTVSLLFLHFMKERGRVSYPVEVQINIAVKAIIYQE